MISLGLHRGCFVGLLTGAYGSACYGGHLVWALATFAYHHTSETEDCQLGAPPDPYSTTNIANLKTELAVVPDPDA